MADLERVSLRQVGKGAIGRVYKGNVADAFNRFSQPSIPTMDDKFLSPKDTREAFGMSSERFNIKRTSDIPGPGVYDSKKIESPSYSKKGYGGITNKTARFKKFQYNTLSPGPGYYDFRISNSSNNAPMITYPKSKSLSIPTETPGVGFYDPFSQSSLLKDGFTSNFKSKSKRLEYNDSISPPP